MYCSEIRNTVKQLIFIDTSKHQTSIIKNGNFLRIREKQKAKHTPYWPYPDYYWIDSKRISTRIPPVYATPCVIEVSNHAHDGDCQQKASIKNGIQYHPRRDFTKEGKTCPSFPAEKPCKTRKNRRGGRRGRRACLLCDLGSEIRIPWYVDRAGAGERRAKTRNRWMGWGEKKKSETPVIETVYENIKKHHGNFCYINVCHGS